MSKYYRENPEEPISHDWLASRAVIAGDLFREGRITRPECFRLEVDLATGANTGPIKFEQNTEYADLVSEGILPRRSSRPTKT